jgi:hypothetical protein
MSGGCIHSDGANCAHQRGSLSRIYAKPRGVLSSARMCKLKKEIEKSVRMCSRRNDYERWFARDENDFWLSLFVVLWWLDFFYVWFEFFPWKKTPSLRVAVFFWKSCFFTREEKLKEGKMRKSKTKKKESNRDDWFLVFLICYLWWRD